MTGRPFILGLTGSIGMGKSTTAGFFRDMGVPVWDADAAVHRLYAPDGAGTRALRDICPEAIGPRGVDRDVLRRWIRTDPGALARIEAVIHPLVADDRASFIARAARAGARVVVVDVPLLYETGAESEVDAVLVVSTAPEEQRRRVLVRPGMTDSDLAAILARQTPDAEKRRRADFVIVTENLEETRAQVQDLLRRLGVHRIPGEGSQEAENARDRAGHRDDGA